MLFVLKIAASFLSSAFQGRGPADHTSVSHQPRQPLRRGASLAPPRARTFCSNAVISCSDFASLNLRSLICLLASPEGRERRETCLATGLLKQENSGSWEPNPPPVTSLCLQALAGGPQPSRDRRALFPGARPGGAHEKGGTWERRRQRNGGGGWGGSEKGQRDWASLLPLQASFPFTGAEKFLPALHTAQKVAASRAGNVAPAAPPTGASLCGHLFCILGLHKSTPAPPTRPSCSVSQRKTPPCFL